ncbi:MAG: hypothetical protein GX446_16040 [Chthonomonadales bacterium]|nr:hypothetical protein [Chthonomonadales bacterium]
MGRRAALHAATSIASALSCVLWAPIPSKGDDAVANEAGPLSRSPLRWSRKLPGAVGHPMPLRTAGDLQGVVITLADGAVVFIDAAGTERWRSQLDLQADSGPVCATLRPGGSPIVVATDVWGSVYAFDGAGKRLWKHARQSRSGGFRTPVIADLDNDGTREIIVSDSRGTLLCIGADGKTRMEVTAGNYRVAAPAVCDVGDGPRHLIFGNDAGDVYRLTSDGRLVWACRPGGRFGRSLPIIVPARSGPAVLLGTSFVSSEPGLMMLDATTGAFRRRCASEVQAYQSTAAPDRAGAGGLAIMFGDKNSVLYGLDADGNRLWARRLEGRGIFHAPSVLASANDMLILQTVRGSGPDGRCLYALTADGRIVDGIALPGGGGSSAIVGRFAGQSSLSLITLSANGTLERRELAEPWSGAAVLWPGAPESRVGQAPLVSTQRARPTPMEERPAVLGTNTIHAVAPSGASYAAIRTASGGSVHTVLLRLADPGPRPKAVVPVRLDSVGRHETQIAWFGANPSRLLSERRYALTVDRRLTEEAAEQADFDSRMAAAMRSDPPHRELLDYLRAACRTQYLVARAERSGVAFDALRAERKRSLALTQLARRAGAEGDIVAVPIANPWRPFNPVATLEASGAMNRIAMEMLGNERESCALALANLTARPMSVRVERGPFEPKTKNGVQVPGARVVRLHEPIAVTPTTTGRPVEDPLPELGEASTIRLGPGEVRMLWLTVSSAALSAGEHSGTLRLGDTTSQRPPVEVRMSIRVSSVRLADRLRYRHCNWLNPASFGDEGIRERVLQDALEHGTSVFVIPPPTVRLHADGTAAAVEGGVHDRLARRLQGRAFLLISGAPALTWETAPPADAQTRDIGFAAAVRAYGEHMRALGFTTDDYALYLQDEPGLGGPNHEFEAFVALVRKVKAADPGMPIYANPAGGATAAMLESLTDLVDVWCPDMHLFCGDMAGLEPIFRAGKEWWHYEAPGDQRNLSPLGFYRMQAWVAFRHGMQGAGYWVHSYDPYWFDRPGQASEYGSVYLTDGAPVATKRWEATRDGIEDYELLSILRAAARSDQGTWSERASLLLDKAVAFVTDGQELVSDIGRQTEPFEPDYRRWMAYRREIIRLLEERSPQPEPLACVY